eukprot:CAMPEP_0172449018 /NCGR_PEP_ID=MMETSP1065-20121228/7856_1 /TAXON_ID=265537 /ORGANISM="Amphiprora paludosa, Strain CCMP125" /LENGTH=743 /DNA_ID=CAMNT_0013200617 /DNA_START=37 /DNA_END=2268 /DNA_ORIENTATION=+
MSNRTGLVDDQQAVIRRRQVPSRRRRNGLLRFANNLTSQNGEDGILDYLFSNVFRSDDNSNQHKTRWCVDVGAWDGVHWSNTHSLLTQKTTTTGQANWRGILVEANDEKFQQLQALHQPLGNICLPVTVSAQRQSPSSLAFILKQQQQKMQQNDPESTSNEAIPNGFDFLCIDIDGMDYWVLVDVLEHSDFRPKVICIEFNPTMPSDLIYIPPPPQTGESRHGTSLAALVELCQTHNYVLVETTLYNAFFVPEAVYQGSDILKELVPDTSIEALHETTMGTTLYQLYDGTLKLWGCQKLLWHRIPIQESNIQMISSQERHFPFAPPPTSGIQRADAEALYNDFIKNHVVVDVHPWCSESALDEARMECAQALLNQLQKDGFAYVRAPLEVGTCQSALELTKIFLQEVDEHVRRSCLVKDRAKRGYSPMNTENFASLLGLDNGGKNDLVRKYRMGPFSEESNNGDEETGDSEQAPKSNSLLQPNVWPSSDEWDKASDFQDTIQDYYLQIVQASNGIVSAICQGLIQQDQTLETSLEPLANRWKNGSLATTPTSSNDSSILTLLGYRTGARHRQGKKKQIPLVMPHTDVSLLTILLFDQGEDCANLQRYSSPNKQQAYDINQDNNKDWVDVPLPPLVKGHDPIFVVNVADCLSELSGGQLPSTLHRVVPTKGNPSQQKQSQKDATTRNGCALFVGLDPHEPLRFPAKRNSEEMPTDATTMTFEEWRKQRIAKAQRALGRGVTNKD